MTERPRNADSGDIPYDQGLARAYRDAAREAPPQELDAAIRAAARREAQARPRSLDEDERSPDQARAGPASRRHWQVPLALAAVLVLSVSIVTLHREETQLPPPAPPRSEPPAMPDLRDAPAAPVQPRPQVPARKPAPEASREAMRVPEQSPRAEVEARGDAALGAAASKAEEAGSEARQLFRGPRAAQAPQRAAEQTAPATALAADEPPAKWGERIMALRRDGKADEADALLAEFRKRHPEHQVPEAWLR
ncbi:MAG: hypothetical protein ACT4PS_09780 [Betaproteobacteria bacterium]